MSPNVAVPTDRPNEARAFYKDVLGFPIRHLEPTSTEFNASPLALFVDTEGDEKLTGPVLELLVDDVEAAREHLLKHGCTVVRWEGLGGDCYMRDPFGLTFNLWQELQV
ncbi:MAG: VOC family protein [Phycisphaeraceae bacterium]